VATTRGSQDPGAAFPPPPASGKPRDGPAPADLRPRLRSAAGAAGRRPRLSGMAVAPVDSGAGNGYLSRPLPFLGSRAWRNRGKRSQVAPQEDAQAQEAQAAQAPAPQAQVARRSRRGSGCAPPVSGDQPRTRVPSRTALHRAGSKGPLAREPALFVVCRRWRKNTWESPESGSLGGESVPRPAAPRDITLI
jgi:hypothetical protein